MSNYQTPALQTHLASKETGVNLHHYVKESALTWFYGDAVIMRTVRECLRSWFSADFIREFDLNDSGERSATTQHQAWSDWKMLNSLIEMAIAESKVAKDKESFETALTEIVSNTIGGGQYTTDDILAMRDRLQTWFDTVTTRWEDKSDNCSSYDHGISFCYLDGLLTLVLDYHQDLALGETK